MRGQEELIETLAVCDILAHENPCHMRDLALGMLAEGLRALMCREYAGGMNQKALSRYYHVDTRTIQRWAHRYKDFPVGRHDGNKEVRYDTMEAVMWKRKHPELLSRT
jgi:hypothetical protein